MPVDKSGAEGMAENRSVTGGTQRPEWVENNIKKWAQDTASDYLQAKYELELQVFKAL